MKLLNDHVAAVGGDGVGVGGGYDCYYYYCLCLFQSRDDGQLFVYSLLWQL